MTRPLSGVAAAVALLALATACAAPQPQAQTVTSPGRGTPERRALLDAVRPAVETELEQPVVFRVEELRTDGHWAFLAAVALTPDYEHIDYAATKYATAQAEGLFDDWLCALLQRDGERWKLVSLEIGATDVPFADWPERYGAPAAVVMGP